MPRICTVPNVDCMVVLPLICFITRDARAMHVLTTFCALQDQSLLLELQQPCSEM